MAKIRKTDRHPIISEIFFRNAFEAENFCVGLIFECKQDDQSISTETGQTIIKENPDSGQPFFIKIPTPDASSVSRRDVWF